MASIEEFKTKAPFFPFKLGLTPALRIAGS